MEQNSQDQNPKDEADQEHLKGESAQARGAKTRRRNAWAIVFDGFGALLIAFAGFSHFVNHLEIPSIAVFFAGAVFVALHIRLSLMNRIGASKANVYFWSITVALFVICVMLTVAVINRPEDPYSGTLKPAHEALPFPKDTSLSDFPPHSAFLFAGKYVVSLAETQSLCVVSLNKECILKIDQENDTAFVSGRFFDEDGKLLAELRSNRFEVALPPVVFRAYRPDKSTLIVRDSRGAEILNLKYLDRSAFLMTGIVRLPDKTTFTITSEYIDPPARPHIKGIRIFGGKTWGVGTAFGF